MDVGEIWMVVYKNQRSLDGEKILRVCVGKVWKECGLMKIQSEYLDKGKRHCFERINS